ncbi:hypothetical protein [Streptomyces sp. NPDC008150]|uniref:hypothetical protein n=1 Tax=Streptomyces sp. NPDC008150 TaxID=3364816 RepID=UPI0036E80546
MTTPSNPADTGHDVRDAQDVQEVEHGADEALARIASRAGDHIAGLIADGMLATTARPDRLPRLLFPHLGLTPDQVQEIWDTALTVGLWAGARSRNLRFHRDALTRLQGELADAGYRAMAGLAAIPAAHAHTEHPADHDTDPVPARGEHW